MVACADTCCGLPCKARLCQNLIDAAKWCASRWHELSVRPPAPLLHSSRASPLETKVSSFRHKFSHEVHARFSNLESAGFTRSRALVILFYSLKKNNRDRQATLITVQVTVQQREPCPLATSGFESSRCLVQLLNSVGAAQSTMAVLFVCQLDLRVPRLAGTRCDTAPVTQHNGRRTRTHAQPRGIHDRVSAVRVRAR